MENDCLDLGWLPVPVQPKKKYLRSLAVLLQSPVLGRPL